MKNILYSILGFLLVLGILTGVGFYTGYIGNFYDATVTKQHMDIERNNFKHSKSYVEGSINDLANYKHEWDSAKTPDEKKQIENFVYNQYSNFDPNTIENPVLYQWLVNIQSGGNK